MRKKNGGLFKLADIIIIATICIIAVTLLFSGSKNESAPVAVITVDGEEIQRIDLTSAEDKAFTLETSPTVTLEIKNSKIRFVNSRCPDGTCEKSGFLSESGDTAACVPAKTVVTIEGVADDSDLDAVAG